MKTAKKKVASDDPENERVKWKQKKTANERTAPKANANNPHKRRGRVPNILTQTKVDEPNAEQLLLNLQQLKLLLLAYRDCHGLIMRASDKIG